ncbi:nose resistant to fluoxetine protein 6 [Acyrthosiphon pisum]|uniref:Nose resistant-to-fluoxetine protein N-terminal domain-containing protein n=1 Tax=Acyrthosiphon pisum TaxID=7029 RepID=A0A8R2A917_ACYPI|nr:nose resistant to fluoxetine protein 6 [Acyrthosiphon pisum]|eukprot:XP_001946627.2 PREDICTED: nose resistant to fluoxetine protein 6 [Acyrthosiphon pisum]
MAKTASAMSTVVAVVAMAVTCCFVLAAGQDSDEAAMMFSEDTSLAADELTARPPSSQEVSAYTSSAGRTLTGKPAATNIQKVSRTAKAVDAMSAMVMMMAAATGSGTGTAAAVAVNNDTATDSGPYTSDLEWLSNVYNPHRWNPVELPAASMLSVQCRDVMKTYLEALRRGSFWAAKMADASGRYSSQLFFGNDFWLGSHTLCKELQNKATNQYVPPFEAKFYVAKLAIKLHDQLTPRTRLISLGLCMPKDCSSTEVQNMVSVPKEDSESNYRSYSVLNVRPVPGTYTLWSDSKFQILLIVVGLVTILTIVGSGYEMILEGRKGREFKKRQIVQGNNNESDSKVEFTLDKMQAIEKMQNMKGCGNDNGNLDEPDMLFKVSRNEQILLAFSAVSNGRKILHCGPAPSESLTCVHGLRFLSLAWVIMVHTYLQVFSIAENKMLRTLTERNFMFQTVSNATFSVDTFFFISGLLVTYLYYKTTNKKDGPEVAVSRTPKCSSSILRNDTIKFFKLLGYRFIRLTPAYMIVLLMAEVSSRWLRNNSVFEPENNNHISCADYWWRNMLYINSLYPRNEMCMLWSWYMSNDTQFYVLAVILLLVSARHFKGAVIGLVAFLIGSWVVTIFVAVHYNFRARIEEPFGLFDQLYDKPWSRLGPYLFGMFAGWFLFVTKCKVKMSFLTVVLGWSLSLFSLAYLVYGLHVVHLDLAGSALYASVGHSAWGAALAWIVIACCTGHGGCVNSALSCRLLQPLSRLTYCAYLVHPIIMTMTNFQMDGPLHLHNLITMILYFGNAVASFLLSFFISLTFEAPVVNLLKIMLSPPQVKKTSMEKNSSELQDS